MKKLASIGFALAAIMFVLAGTGFAEALPAFKLKSADGSMVSNETLKDKSAVLVFAQTACSQCRTEMKAIDKNLEAIQEKARVYVVLVDTNEERGAMLYEQMGFKAPVIFDSSYSLPSALGINATPATVVVDKTGTITMKQVGYSPAVISDIMGKI
ncbi:MAG: TlpA disulfide reductase family protein [Deferrisomatales bacterium]|nr:TlpA disulfide reductase family protein [Deferrisomatales bacterium]